MINNNNNNSIECDSSSDSTSDEDYIEEEDDESSSSSRLLNRMIYEMPQSKKAKLRIPTHEEILSLTIRDLASMNRINLLIILNMVSPLEFDIDISKASAIELIQTCINEKEKKIVNEQIDTILQEQDEDINNNNIREKDNQMKLKKNQ